MQVFRVILRFYAASALHIGGVAATNTLSGFLALSLKIPKSNVRHMHTMNEISLEQLTLEGYTEDKEGLKRFQRAYTPFFFLILLVFIASLISFFTDAWPYAVVTCLASIAFGFLGIAVMYRASPLSRHSGKPLVKYINKKPKPLTLTEIVYVCPESKTYFSRSFSANDTVIQ